MYKAYHEGFHEYINEGIASTVAEFIVENHYSTINGNVIIKLTEFVV